MNSTAHVILDIRGLLLHAYHGGEDRDARRIEVDGKPTKVNTAAFGLNAFIDRYFTMITAHYQPRQIIAVWDGSNDRRRTMFPDYKLKRRSREKVPEMEAELSALQNLGKAFLASLGVTQMRVASCEADDVIAMLCQRLEGYKLVYTVDADLLALAGEKTMVFLKGEPVEETYKNTPLHLISLQKSILGDQSDGYPGVKGLGEAAWQKLVETYDWDGMEELERCVANQDYRTILAALNEEDNATLRKLYEKRDEWRASYSLARLHPEWCEGQWAGKYVKIDWYKRVPSRERLRSVLEAAGSGDRLPEFDRLLPTTWLIDASNFEEKDIEEAAQLFAQSPHVSFDYETYDCLEHPAYKEVSADYVDVLSQRMTGASFNFGPNLQYTFYLTVNHADSANLPVSVVERFLKAVPSDVPLVAQNAPFELAVTQHHFGWTPTLVHDTAIMASYVNENEPAGLKHSSKLYLNYDQTTYEQVTTGEDGVRRRMDELSARHVLNYGCDDAIVTGSLYDLYKLILQIEGTWESVREFEFDFGHVMTESFIDGAEVDFERLAKLAEDDQAALERTDERMREVLKEHAAQMNESGYETLFAERWALDLAKLREANADMEVIAKRRECLQDECREACRYISPAPDPELVEKPLDKKVMAATAKSLGLPQLRSADPKRLAEWVASLQRQIAENPALKATEAQVRFLGLLSEAAPVLKKGGPAVAKLQGFCREVLREDKRTWIGDELSARSPKQMSALLYGILGLPVLIRNEVKPDTARDKLGLDGAPATNEMALQTWLAEMDEGDWRREVLQCVHDVKAVLTRQSLYYTPYPLWRSPVDGRIHPQIKNCGTVTRRPSGTSPNILQVSKIKDEGRVRSCYLPRSRDEIIISVDFSQQELRLLAGLCRDPNMLAAYIGAVEQRIDIHSMTASGVFGAAYDAFIAVLNDKGDPQHLAAKRARAIGKMINFLLAYGGTAAGLSRKAIIPLAEAELFVNRTFATYPKMVDWQQATIEEGRRKGYVETAYGSRRHLPDLLSSDNRKRSAAERQAINAPIQGTAADILKRVVQRARRERLFEETKSRMLAPVYDEIASSVPKVAAVEYIARLSEYMSITPPGMDVPQVPDVSIGLTWGEQIELGAYPSEAKILEALEQLEEKKHVVGL